MNKSNHFFQNIIKPFKLNSRKEGQEEDLEKLAAEEHKDFAFQTLVSATKNFHHQNKLGHGEFGPVFKGRLEDGREIVVKRLSHNLFQMVKELTKEARLLTRVQHRNVVNLLGYCVHPEKLLVYEYVVNESLDKFIFGSTNQDSFDWKRRYDIICGIARGLRYLHEGSHECFIHRDLKASNILLDEKWVPKIADFGMATLYPEDLTRFNTRVADTNGYMAPEYAMHGSLTLKTDVYSFGVLLLEIISGQKNSNFTMVSDCKNLLDWAYKMYKKGKAVEIIEARLVSLVDPDQVMACVKIGLLCTQSDPQLRPTMDHVVMMLSKKSSALDEPTRPGIPGTRYRRSWASDVATNT
uniref:cysteine-rich receptor-like protein kinase 10 n=1 Tax=Erigeron canadensis TaxID=72917 RepID=UPI001CB9236E|nr:cysteine-rich receptor-like protein kinase 10 [Erigeron canadensis]